MIENSKLESSEGKPSIRALASSSIASAVSAVQPTTPLIESVVKSLVSEFDSLQTIQETGDIPVDSGPPDLLHIRNCLCLLGAWMLKEHARRDILERFSMILPGLALLLSLAKDLLGDNEGLAGTFHVMSRFVGRLLIATQMSRFLMHSGCCCSSVRATRTLANLFSKLLTSPIISCGCSNYGTASTLYQRDIRRGIRKTRRRKQEHLIVCALHWPS